MCSSDLFGIDMRVPDLDYDALRRLVGQWREMVGNYYGDYYPLTAWTRDTTLWMAWQFDRPEAGQGITDAAKREAIGEDRITLYQRHARGEL